MTNSSTISVGVVILIYVASFLIISAIFMALWNSVVMKALKDGSVNKINYSTAIGLTLFVSLFLTTGSVVVNRI